MGLVVVQNDATHSLVKRRGRFSVPKEAAVSAEDIAQHGLENYPHLLGYVKHYVAKMVKNLAMVGYRHTGSSFDLLGPMDHVEYADDRYDPGPGRVPHPGEHAGDRYRDEIERLEHHERSLAAQRMGGPQDELVDYELISSFVVKEKPSFRSNNFSLGKGVFDPLRPPSVERLKTILRQRPEIDRGVLTHGS